MTKLVTSLAVLQQVEAGVLSYDDPAIVQKYAPELVKQRILISYDEETKEAKFADLERPPTVRDLVTHTSGQVYFFFDPKLYAYDRDHGLLAMFGSETGQFAQPFLFSPGTRLAYGTGLDWAGIILERATGQDLESYFRQHISTRLGCLRTQRSTTPPKSSRRDNTPSSASLTGAWSSASRNVPSMSRLRGSSRAAPGFGQQWTTTYSCSEACFAPSSPGA